MDGGRRVSRSLGRRDHALGRRKDRRPFITAAAADVAAAVFTTGAAAVVAVAAVTGRRHRRLGGGVGGTSRQVTNVNSQTLTSPRTRWACCGCCPSASPVPTRSACVQVIPDIVWYSAKWRRWRHHNPAAAANAATAAAATETDVAASRGFSPHDARLGHGSPPPTPENKAVNYKLS